MWSYETTKKSAAGPIASRDWITSTLTFTDADKAAEAAAEWIAISAVNGYFPAVRLVDLNTGED